MLAFRNGIRLHHDSIRLYRAGAHPSALALSILALEEIGKYFILEDFVWHSRIDGPYTPEQDQAILRDAYDHGLKQQWFAHHADLPRFARHTLRAVTNGNLDGMKLQALHVGLQKRGRRVVVEGQVLSPFRVTRRHARKQITEVNDVILGLAVGVVNGEFLLDAEGIERILTRHLVRTLTRRWRLSGRAAKSYVRRRLRRSAATA